MEPIRNTRLQSNEWKINIVITWSPCLLWNRSACSYVGCKTRNFPGGQPVHAWAVRKEISQKCSKCKSQPCSGGYLLMTVSHSAAHTWLTFRGPQQPLKTLFFPQAKWQLSWSAMQSTPRLPPCHPIKLLYCSRMSSLALCRFWALSFKQLKWKYLLHNIFKEKKTSKNSLLIVGKLFLNMDKAEARFPLTSNMIKIF